MSAETEVGVGEEGVPEGGTDPQSDATDVEEITRRPTRLSSLLAVVTSLLAALTSAAGGSTALGLAGLGVPVLVLALLRGYPRAIDLGGLLLLSGVTYAGYVGASIPVVLTGTVATVLAWDLANYAFSVGFQLGRETRTGRVESLHAAASTGVGVVVAAGGYALYLSGAEGLPVSTVVVMVLGAAALLAVLRL